jgi:hypothetical protein
MMLALISGQASNEEQQDRIFNQKQQERTFNQIKRILLAPQATAAHSGQIILNLLVCLQAEKSKLPEVVPLPNYTTNSSTKVNQRGHMRD